MEQKNPNMLQSTYHADICFIYFIDIQALSFHLLGIIWSWTSVQVVSKEFWSQMQGILNP